MDTKKFMAWFISIIMALSIMGFLGGSFFATQKDETAKQYHDVTFYQRGNQWLLQSSDQWYSFSHFPQELENISMPLYLEGWLQSDKIYLGYLPNDTLIVESQLNLLGAVLLHHKVTPQKACVVEQGCPDIPIINCDKRSIILRSGNATSASLDNNCVVMTSDTGEGLQKITERLIYKFLGVMP